MPHVTLSRFKDSIRKAPLSLLFQVLLAAAFVVPLAATLGQFADSGFLGKEHPFLLLFWPGAEWKWAPPLPVWLTVGTMGLSYVIGVLFMVRHRTFGTVVLWSIAAIVAAQFLGLLVNSLTGWKDLQSLRSLDLAGKANAAIFASWQNPLWEEAVFRGIPLLAVVFLQKKFPAASGWFRWSYVIIPNLIFAIYHVPGHGPSRLADTFVLGCAFSWMALRYSFFAPLVMHYVLDAMVVVGLSKLPGIRTEEIPWLVQNSVVLNSSWSLAVLVAFVSLPAIALWNTFFRKKERAALTADPEDHQSPPN